jgi:D-alanine-D-alanine ligase-like ATP-grasp enzyme
MSEKTETPETPEKKSARKRRSGPRRRLRVAVLMHEDLVPPEDTKKLSEVEFDRIKTECDVLDALDSLGHQTRAIGVRDELAPIRDVIEEWSPHICFNLLDEFQGEAIYDQHVVAYLELHRIPYTGNNPRGLVLARDKALSKKVAMYHRIRAPRFFVVRSGRRVRRPKRLEYPLIVKSLLEEASMGISKASVVRDDEALAARVDFVHEHIGTDAIVEQFIPGREVYVGVLGNDRLPRASSTTSVTRRSTASGSPPRGTSPTTSREPSSEAANESIAPSRSKATRASTTDSPKTASPISSRRTRTPSWLDTRSSPPPPTRPVSPTRS